MLLVLGTVYPIIYSSSSSSFILILILIFRFVPFSLYRGLGKTVQSISFMAYLQFEFNMPGPFLVVVPLSTVANWEAEWKKWTPGMNVVCFLSFSPSLSYVCFPCTYYPNFPCICKHYVGYLQWKL